jgi:hypothetical protein
MQIFIKTIDGNKFTIIIQSYNTVSKLKDTISELKHLKKESQRLIFQGAPLLDENTLEQLNIKEGSIIHLSQQLSMM